MLLLAITYCLVAAYLVNIYARNRRLQTYILTNKSYYMKLTKRDLLLSVVNDYLIDSPAPANINYFWGFGSLLGLNFVIVIVSGLTLAMHYTPHVDLAFSSVEHIMRDVNNGW